ncbi:L,D-transpeptidase family protein [Qipengyuania sp. GH38]|uniref:L,D-transpeptidase family protein n=1 Tax=Qipengyuania intermedia TaxID=2867244 RepID=UPI001C88D58F|nr:L,D-transpeptidase family protein [Qipengyuania intermedia]MBX7513444.1 L,D-transpeptidase family protein [Qipengyuania intermedia]
MDAILKWIGGTTLVVALGLAALAFGVTTSAQPELDKAPEAAAPAKLQPEAAILAKLEADAKRPFTIRRVLPIEGPIKYGEWHWDDEGVPEGPLLITVDLQARTISIFRDGYEIGAAAVMLGTDEHPTPTGTFPILTKERHNVSEKYGNAPMPWTLRLTWDGIAIHGGSEVENGYASHGCVAIPDPLAARLFDIAKKGDKVIITDGKRIGVGDPII